MKLRYLSPPMYASGSSSRPASPKGERWLPPLRDALNRSRKLMGCSVKFSGLPLGLVLHLIGRCDLQNGVEAVVLEVGGYAPDAQSLPREIFANEFRHADVVEQ